jgi:hypothetical protein
MEEIPTETRDECRSERIKSCGKISSRITGRGAFKCPERPMDIALGAVGIIDSVFALSTCKVHHQQNRTIPPVRVA